MSIIIGVMEEGLIYAIMALGLYITYKILDFPDLSVDGTFPMGAAVTAMLILKGVHPVLTLLISFAAGNTFLTVSIMAEDKSVVTVLTDSRFRCGSLRKIPLTASVATPRTIATKAPLRPLAALLVRIV